MGGAANQAKVINDALLRISVSTDDDAVDVDGDATSSRFRQITHAVHQKTSPSSVTSVRQLRG